MEDISNKTEMRQILSLGIFERFILLSIDQNADRYFEVYDGEGELLCGRSLLQPLV
jgi:hypothetical protein